jgi:hypothetical protein
MIIEFQRTRNGVPQRTALHLCRYRVSSEALRQLSAFVFSGPHTQETFKLFMEKWMEVQ